MIGLPEFCRAFDLDGAAASRALAGPLGAAERAAPWFTQAILGFGAWITAVAAAAAGVGFLFITLEVDGPEPIAIPGCGYLIAGLWALARPGGVFRTQFGISITAAGIVMTTVGAAATVEAVWVGAVVSIVLAVLAEWLGRNRQLQFLSTAFAAAMVIVTLDEQRVPYLSDIVAFMAPAGLFLFLRPPTIDLRPTAIVLLLAPMAVDILHGFAFGPRWTDTGWLAEAVFIASFLALLWLLRKRPKMGRASLELAAAAVVAVALTFLLPIGGLVALLMLTLAYLLGSAALAVIGALLQSYFIFRFYYDLEQSLLEKSLIMTAAGVVLLALWCVLARRQAKGGQP